MTNSESNESQSRPERPPGVTPGIVKNNLYNLENELWSLDAPMTHDSSSSPATEADLSDHEPALLLEADQLPVIDDDVGVRVIEDPSLNHEDDVGLTTRRPRALGRRRRGKAIDQSDQDVADVIAEDEPKPEHHFMPDKSSIIRPHESNIWDSLDLEEQSNAPVTAETWTSEPTASTHLDSGSDTDAAKQVLTPESTPETSPKATSGDRAAFVEPMTETAADSVPLPSSEATPLAEATEATTGLGDPQDSHPAAGDTASHQSAADATAKATAFRIPRISIAERMSLFIFAAVALVGMIIAIVAFYRNIPAEINPYRLPDLPVKGEIVRITAARTYWRAPIRDGANPDTTKADTIMLPVLELTIADCPNPNGAVRLFFRNEKNELVGDPITRAYSNMNFTLNGSATLAMASTFGFNDFGAHQAYRAEKALPWKIEVFEGPDESAPRESFKKVTTLPISSNQQ